MRTTTRVGLGAAVTVASMLLTGCGGKSSSAGRDGGSSGAQPGAAGKKDAAGVDTGPGGRSGVGDGTENGAGTGADTDGGSHTDGGSVADADAGVDPQSTVPLCEQWQRDWGTETQWAMNAWGFERSATIFEGRIGEVSAVDDSLSRARVTVEKMWFGWGHFEGHTVAVDIDPAWLTALGDADTVIFGVHRSYPLEAESGLPPRFDFVEAAIPASDVDLFPGRIGYHQSDDEWIGVARMVESDGEWQRFEVVQTLSGSSLSRFEYHFVPFDGVPLPSASETEFLIAGTKTGYVSVSADFMRIDDFRVATEEARALVEAGLADPPKPMAVDRLGGDAERYRAGWLLAISDHVVSAEVSGMANECCTNSGGSYAAYDVVGRYRGADNVTGLAQFFAGFYPNQACGDGYLLGFDEMSQVTPEQVEGAFTCDLDGDVPANPEVAFSQAKVTLPATAENTAYAQAALESAGPLYRLYNLDETVDPSSFPDDDDIKLWSLPLDIMDGISAAEQMIRLEVEEVVEHDEWTEVRIATCLTETALCGSELFHLKLALPCGDARLKQVGSTWLAGLIDPSRSAANQDRVIAEAKLFLVPGVLVPPYFGRLGQRF